MTTDAQTMPDGARLLPRGPFTRWPRVADTVFAIVMFMFIVSVEFEETSGDVAPRVFGDLSIGAFLVVAAACGALIWRRSQPAVVLGVTLAAIALSSALGYPETVGLAMLVGLYSVGRYVTDDRWSYAGLGGAIAVGTIASVNDGAPLTDLASGFLILSAVWYLGRRVGARGDYLRLLHERAELLEREQESAAQRAVAEERTRIARELHDVVAHRVTMMTVQAGAAKTIAAEDPEGALRAMEAVEDAGREALGELRHLLGVLRPEVEADGLGPQPGVADVPRLVDQFREAGLDVSLKMDGVRTDLPAPVDLSAYRIVQEALTNVLKHAGASARTEVRLSTDNDEVTIEVLDNGHGATVLPGAGQGIVGMRERAMLLGGSLDAEPLPGAGFRVVAHLRVREEPA